MSTRSHAPRAFVAAALTAAAIAACGDATTGTASGSGGAASSVGTSSTTNATSSAAQGATSGTSGATSTTGAGVGGGGALCPATAFFCDDFESYALGVAPGGTWDAGSQGVVTADHARSGVHAVRLDEGFNFQKLPLAQAPDVIFARVMMWSAFQGDTTDSRYSIFSIETQAGHQAAIDSNGDLLVIHHYPNGEAGIDSTRAVPTGRWTCIETSFDRTTRTFRSWVDGVEATELDAPASTEPITDPWSLFQLSGVVYHGGTTTQYYDDVALSTERIGCP